MKNRIGPIAHAAALSFFLAIVFCNGVVAQTVTAGSNIWAVYNATTNPTGQGCNNCHGASGPRANVASDSNATNLTNASTLLLDVWNNIASMNKYGTGGASALGSTDRKSLALYLESVINTTPRTYVTAFNATITNQSLNAYVRNGTSGASIDVIEAVTNPANGTVSFVSTAGSESFTYNPSSNFTGSDSFTYRARNTSN